QGGVAVIPGASVGGQLAPYGRLCFAPLGGRAPLSPRCSRAAGSQLRLWGGGMTPAPGRLGQASRTAHAKSRFYGFFVGGGYWAGDVAGERGGRQRAARARGDEVRAAALAACRRCARGGRLGRRCERR